MVGEPYPFARQRGRSSDFLSEVIYVPWPELYTSSVTDQLIGFSYLN